MLYAATVCREGRDFSHELRLIRERYDEIVDGLSLELSLDDEFAVIEQNFKVRAGRDYAASRGEYLNGIVMARYLNFEFIDAAK